MGFIISGQATGSVTTTVPGDLNAQNTTLLLSGNGSNNATNNTFVDSSSNNFAITRVGNTTQGTFSPYGDNWSNYFDGSTSYLTTASSSASAGNFTMEAWIYRTAATLGVVIGYGSETTGRTFMYVTSGGGLVVGIYNVGDTTFGGSIPINQWTHIAIVRSTNVITGYINGTAQATTVSSAVTIGNANGFGVGAGKDGSNKFTGFISNARVVDGVAVYTSAFTPSTTPLTAISGTSLLTCQANRLIDSSTNAFTITKNGDTQVQRFSPFAPSAAYSASTTGGSAYFDGNSDYLSVPDNDSWALGNNFTIECWVYFTTTSGIQQFINQRASSSDAWQFLYNYPNSGDLTFKFADGNVAINKPWSPTVGQWYHIAVTRSSSTWYLFANGVQLGATATNSTTFPNIAASVWVGTLQNPTAESFVGYMCDMRVVKSSVYTTAFTPPTAPLTAIATTQLLLNYTNAGIVDNAMMTNLETVGDVKISTTQSKFGGSSMYFDGTGDYLITPANPVSNLGTGDFTIEMWVYLTNSEATTQTIMGGDLSTQSASTNTIQIWYNNGGSRNKISFNVYGNPRFDSSSSVSINNWMHLAFTRSSGTFKMFINGTQEASGSLPNNLSNNVFVVGRGYISFNQEYFHGYIDDLRVTKGVARYTSNFTAPTSALLAGGSVTSTTTGPIASGMTMSGTGSGMVISSYVAPWTIGGFYQGGYYCGNFVDNGVTYKLLAAPSSTVSGLGWGPSAVSGFQSRITGPTNSAGEAALGSSYAAATYCESLTSGGYSDWYLPAVNELQTAITNTNGVAPFASGGAQSWSGQFWSSSELDVDYRDGYMNLNRWWPQDHAWFVNGTTVYGTYGVIDKNNKSASYSVRAFRRVAA